MIGFSFDEVMEGSVQRDDERFDRPFRFELRVRAPNVLGFAGTAVGEATGHARLDGLAKEAPARGRIELSPFRGRRIRYVFDFRGDDGATYTFDGHKTIGGAAFQRGWTTLPGEVRRADGSVWARAVLRFSLRHQLAALLKSFRLNPHATPAHAG
jgi:hypothetical protein